MPAKKGEGLKDPLLHARLRIYGSGAKLQESGFRVTPLDPRREAQKMVTTSLEEGCAIDGVERVFEVNLEEHFILVPRDALEPLARNPNANFRSQGLSAMGKEEWTLVLGKPCKGICQPDGAKFPRRRSV